jgi:hypothetical protein
LVSTLHRSERDAAIEIRAWQARMRIGDVSHAHLIDLRPGGKLTNRNILADIKIAWSWLKATSQLALTDDRGHHLWRHAAHRSRLRGLRDPRMNARASAVPAQSERIDSCGFRCFLCRSPS